MKWVRIGVSSILSALVMVSAVHAKTFCMVKVHGKGGPELAQPDNYWAEDYWANGQFQSIAQPCGGMPTLTTHADGAYGQDVAFDVQYCGCGISRWQGCDYLWTPPAGIADPGTNAPWPNAIPHGHYGPGDNDACTQTGPYWPRAFPVVARYEGVLEQINRFLDQTGCDDLTIVTHSNGGNIIREGFSMTDLYTRSLCHQNNSSLGTWDPGCIRLRQHQLRVMNTTTTVITLHPPSLGSEAADDVAWLSGSWLTGWIAGWIGTPYNRATQELTTGAMLNRNTKILFGTSNPSRPWPLATFDGIPLRPVRWITALSHLTTTQMAQDGVHAEDYELAGAAAVVSFPNGYSDGLVSWPSQAAVYSSGGDIWYAVGQHDQAAAATFGGGGNNGNNHTHARMGANGGGGWWRPAYWRQENTTPMPLGWPGPAFPAPGGPGGCTRQDVGNNISYFTCPTWPVPSYASHGLAVKACPDASCLTNQTRGYPGGADEAFWISAFVEARAASSCGPAITNSTNISSGQWINYYRNYVDYGAVGGAHWGPSWQLVGQTTIYEAPYAPNAGTQVCGWQC